MKTLSVLLCTQGTYPFSSGGVSTWCDQLCKQMTHVEFTIYALTGLPQVEPLFQLSVNTRGIIPVPLWGMQEPAEFIRTDMSLAELHGRKSTFTNDAVEHVFIPALRRILWTIFADQCSMPLTERHWSDCGRALYEMWKYFQRYDWNLTWKSELTWEVFNSDVMRAVQAFPEHFVHAPSIHDLTVSLRALHHHLMLLNAPLPKHDIVHSTLAGFAAIAGVIAKHAYNTPMVVTEHGIFVREQYIAVSQDKTLTEFVRRFLISFSNVVCKLAYHYADIISPVCRYNSRWELEYGANPDKIRVIYNSIDTDFFVPQPKPPQTAHRPTVVASARVFPLKDLETMIRAAAFVRQEIPDVQFIVYGSTTDEPEYAEHCFSLVESLHLKGTFVFAGLHPRSPAMYTNGDICVLSSISEAFPYAVLEAMSCQRAVVATDVGGIREILEGRPSAASRTKMLHSPHEQSQHEHSQHTQTSHNHLYKRVEEHSTIAACGIIVPPRHPKAFADAVVLLLRDQQLREQLAKRGREEAVRYYQAHTTIEGYQDVYTYLHSIQRGFLPVQRVKASASH
jgi:glycosyltransferase involved in cell wall biosynthesis